MKISILNDTSRTTNWGCAGTMTGLKNTLGALCENEKVRSIELKPLPYRKIKLLRMRAVNRMANCLLARNQTEDTLSIALKGLNYELADDGLPERLYLNGEGDIHARSGHLVRLLGIASLHKCLGVDVRAVNQSVDLKPESREAELVSSVYNRFDYISVREPYSLRLLNEIGVKGVELIPDAAFSLPPVPDGEAASLVSGLKLPDSYVCLTGSSDLNARSADRLIPVYESLRRVTGLPVIVLASTKTDKALGKILQNRNPGLRVITDSVDYRTAMAVIAGSEMLVGGRFHLAIFASLQATPVVPFEGNTHKIRGLVELLDYPVASMRWVDRETYPAQMGRVFNNRKKLGEMLRVRSHDLAKQVRRLAAPDIPG